jgi:CelD/BcsL family acetyltransferase involved in cellulose biosynthesis
MLTAERLTAAESSVQVLRHLERLQDLADPWDRLAEQAGCPAASAAWSIAAARAFNLQGRLRVITVMRDGQLSAVAPLVNESPFLRPWQLIGLRQMSEPADFLSEDEFALENLVSQLVRLGAPLHLGRLPADSGTIARLRESFHGRGYFSIRQAPACPRIPLDSTWREPERQLGSDRRQDLRRARRRAEEMGDVAFESHAPGPGEVDPLLDEAYRVEATGWKGRSLTSLAGDPLRGRFIRLLSRAAAHRGWLRIAFLRVGGTAAAMQIGLELARAHWVLKIGYDERFRRASPGTLLTFEMIRSAARSGLSSYEFLGTEEVWLRPWARDVRSCVSIRAHPPRIGALLALGFEGARTTWNRARLAVRPR